MTYVENPKTYGSGIYCAIPQDYQHCKRGCADCFYQNGRSYLEPLEHNLPNVPPHSIIDNYVIRVNDGLDSGQDIDRVIEKTWMYPDKFYNTADPGAVVKLQTKGEGPVVLTINPGDMTDRSFVPYSEDLKDLMFVRFRANMWNRKLLAQAVADWCGNGVPLVITYMRYYDEESIPFIYHRNYLKKEHILNPSWGIDEFGWHAISVPHKNNPLVSTCGLNANTHQCRYCGVCLREYWRSVA
jgi:hypothetical protein